MLAGKVEDMLNTVVRQIAFYEFEARVHTERRQGELSADRICDIWMDIQAESLGPAIRFHNEYKYFLDLHSAFHPLAVLCLRLCVWRLFGELTLCGL